MEYVSFLTSSTPDFSAQGAVDLIAADYRLLEGRLATLLRLADYLHTHGPDKHARRTAESLIRHFDAAAKSCVTDEEQALFPALIESMAGSDAVCLRELTQSLAKEHRRLEALWEPVRAALVGIDMGAALALVRSDVENYIGVYCKHIRREELEFLPMADRLVSSAVMDNIGQMMRERRQIATNISNAAL